MQLPLPSARSLYLLLALPIWLPTPPCAFAKDVAFSSLAPATADSATCPHRTQSVMTHIIPQICPTGSPYIPAGSSVNPANSSDAIGSISSSEPARPALRLTRPVVEAIAEEQAPSAIPRAPSAAIPTEESDFESPLGKDNFLSFEEWKLRNLDKYGQSAEQVGKPKSHEAFQVRRPPLDVLDALGDDPEIDLDFSAFASEKPQFARTNQKEAHNANQDHEDRSKEIRKARSRSQDAGKTCKERFNYASFDCAATVLKTNPKSSGSAAVLVENKDSYMLNECSVENKFLILELCEDILIDTLVLANFEFFSSIFRTFTVSVSDRYPAKAEKWENLGTFEARNTREVQAFLVENPMIWAKYVRIEFRTHYGNEFYCPVSLVRVHGTTMLEDYRRDEDRNKPEDGNEDEDRLPESARQTDPVTVGAVAEILIEEKNSKSGAQRKSSSTAQTSIANGDDKAAEVTAPMSSQSSKRAQSDSASHQEPSLNATLSLTSLLQQQCLVDNAKSDGGPANISASNPNETTTAISEPQPSSIKGTATASNQPIPPQKLTSTQPMPTTRLASRKSSSQPSSAKPSTQSSDRTVSTKSIVRVEVDASRPPATAAQPPAPNPTIQESFFKSVQKRLQMIEANSTLSLQYIEDQSRMLRDAFGKVEQRQFSKTINFLDYLNGTVMNELRDFRKQYDQLWQTTVMELETQSERSQREVVAMGTRLSILADELVFQKRMAILQSILVLFCIILVLFPRGAMNNYLEHPLLQNMLSRSATLKSRAPFLDTPSMSPVSSRPSSSYKTQAKVAYGTLMGHDRNLSADSLDGAHNPAISYSPPTPSTYDRQASLGAREDAGTSMQSASIESDSPPDLDNSEAGAAARRSSEPDDLEDCKSIRMQPVRRRSTDDRSSPSPVSSVRFADDSPIPSPSEECHTNTTPSYLQVPNG